MEERILKCPNCGANATNHQNCEYCGSLLVRFVDKGINLSNTSYTSDSEVFPGLIQHLQQNIKMQDFSDECVATDIYRQLGKKEWYSNGWVMSVLRTGKCTWQDGQSIALGEGNQGLCVAFEFDTYRNCNSSYENSYNLHMSDKLNRFEELDSFPLFTPHTSCDGNLTRREYAIDFGKDVEGAARLISEVMQRVFQIPLSENVQILTNQGNAIDNARNQAIENRNPTPSKDDKWDYLDYVLRVVGIIIAIVILLRLCS